MTFVSETNFVIATFGNKGRTPSRSVHAIICVLVYFRIERERKTTTLHVVCECSACLPLSTPRSLSLLPYRSAPACHGIKTNARRRGELVHFARFMRAGSVSSRFQRKLDNSNSRWKRHVGAKYHVLIVRGGPSIARGSARLVLSEKSDFEKYIDRDFELNMPVELESMASTTTASYNG